MRLAFATALAFFASPVLADAVTYSGDFNTVPIVLELSDPADAASISTVGRYFQVRDGIDVPLRVTATGSGTIEITEEAACKEDDCEIDQSGLIQARSPEAIWTLQVINNGTGLVGTRGSTGSQSFPVNLERTASRPFTPNDPPSPADLAEFSLGVMSYGPPLTRESSPYDFLKVNVWLEPGPKIRWGDTEHMYFTDPRTLYAYPRITDRGGKNSAVNEALEQRDWGMRLAALNCQSQIYPSMSLSGFSSSEASLGGFDEEQIEVHYLTRQLLSFSESGSLWCGGAYPENHYHMFNLDVATGETIDMSRLLKGYVPRDFMSGEIVDLDTARQDHSSYNWGADDDLAAFILSRADLPDDELADECGYDTLVRNNLAIGFRRPDLIVFSLDGLPHVMGACAQDLLVAPVAELKAVLLPGAESYFPGILD
ncbi:MAG: hypothetical protein ABL879_13910 [Devosia sp.]